MTCQKAHDMEVDEQVDEDGEDGVECWSLDSERRFLKDFLARISAGDGSFGADCCCV